MPSLNTTTVASLNGVGKRRGGRPVLADFDLDVRAGEVTALLGPNGAGKSTAVGVLIGLLDADAGEARLWGSAPRRPAVRARMGVMLQDAGLPETLSVGELIELQRGYYPRPRSFADTIARAGLGGLETRRCGALSGGQARRVQYALAICGAPDLLVLDEPTAGLDPDARRALWTTVRDDADAGAAVLLTTHHLDEADALADRVVVIADGRIVADSTPAAIKAEVAGASIRCRTALAAARLSTLPAVRGVTRAGAEAILLSTDAAATARALLAADVHLADLSIAAASLEDALEHVTANTALKEAA